MAEEKKWTSLALHVSAAREKVVERLEALAKRLNCRKGDLAWWAIEHMLDSPPKVAPAGAGPRTGTASGFWVVNEMGEDNGPLENVYVQEVNERADISGQLFFRYKSDEDKSRGRAMKNAVKAAAFNAQMGGLDIDEIKVIELEEKAAKPKAKKKSKKKK